MTSDTCTVGVVTSVTCTVGVVISVTCTAGGPLWMGAKSQDNVPSGALRAEQALAGKVLGRKT